VHEKSADPVNQRPQQDSSWVTLKRAVAWKLLFHLTDKRKLITALQQSDSRQMDITREATNGKSLNLT